MSTARLHSWHDTRFKLNCSWSCTLTDVWIILANKLLGQKTRCHCCKETISAPLIHWPSEAFKTTHSGLWNEQLSRFANHLPDLPTPIFPSMTSFTKTGFFSKPKFVALFSMFGAFTLERNVLIPRTMSKQCLWRAVYFNHPSIQCRLSNNRTDACIWSVRLSVQMKQEI